MSGTVNSDEEDSMDQMIMCAMAMGWRYIGGKVSRHGERLSRCGGRPEWVGLVSSMDDCLVSHSIPLEPSIAITMVNRMLLT